MLQLPPVPQKLEQPGANANPHDKTFYQMEVDYKDKPFIFQAKTWHACFPEENCFFLEKIYRQDPGQGRLLRILEKIRRGVYDDDCRNTLTSRVNVAIEDMGDVDIKPTRLHTTNASVNAFNSRELGKIQSPMVAFNSFERAYPANHNAAVYLKNCLAPAKLELKIGAQVMLLKSQGVGLVNGSRGVII
jgi:ATP-dependent DNA helicase PIF1